MTQSCANWLTPRRCPQGSFLPWVFTSHCLGASAYPVTRDVRTLKREQVLTSSSFPAQGPWHLQKQLPGSSLALEGAGTWIFVCLFCLAFQLDTRGTVWEQEHPLRKCHHQIGPWAFPWLVTDGRGYCPPHLGLVVLGCLRKQTERVRSSKTVSDTPLSSLLQFLSWFPTVMDCSLWGKINPFLLWSSCFGYDVPSTIEAIEI